jgi:hypothetical protein
MAASAVVEKLLSILSASPDVSAGAFEEAVRGITRQVMKFQIQAGAGVITAGTALAETPVEAVRQKSRLVGAFLISSAAITANATNFLTLIARKRTKLVPGTQVACLSLPLDTPTTDDVVAWDAHDIFAATGTTKGTDAALLFETEDVLTLEVTKTASGLSLPIGALYFVFEPRDA